MSLSGKASLSIRKKDVQEQKSLALGFKNLVFAHKATAGETGININSLVAPSEMSSVGFVNPSVSDLQAANMMFYRKNLRITSSLKGVLMDYLSYNVATNSQINFNGFTAEDGEIFVCHIDYKPITSQMVVDGRSISVTGELAVGVTDFNVGTPFEVGKNYQSAQVGAVLVFRNGQIQARNSNNSSTNLDGNYYEVDGGNGLGSVIRFNTAPSVQADNIMVVSNGLLVERPTGSMMAEVESLAGQIDAMIPVLSAVSGQPTSAFQAAPHNVDLRTFGDRVIAAETNITALKSAYVVKVRLSTTQPIPTTVGTPVGFDVVVADTMAATLGSSWQFGAGYNPTNGTFTQNPGFVARRKGWYRASFKTRFTDNAGFASGEGLEHHILPPDGVRLFGDERDFYSGVGRAALFSTVVFYSDVGQLTTFAVYQASGVSQNVGGHEGPTDKRTFLDIEWIGE